MPPVPRSRRYTASDPVARKEETIAADYPEDWPLIALAVKDAAGWKCEDCHQPHNTAAGYMLTVHHLDADKSNCHPDNTKALCQRCHLRRQARLIKYGPEDERQTRMW